MKVLRLSFLGTRTASADATTAFFHDVLGLDLAYSEQGWSVFRLPSGRRDFVEVYGPEQRDTRLFPEEASGAPLVAFAVDDLAVAREEMVAADTELIGDIVWAAEAFDDPAAEGFGWFFFRAPDGNVYVIQQEGPPGREELP